MLLNLILHQIQTHLLYGMLQIQLLFLNWKLTKILVLKCNRQLKNFVIHDLNKASYLNPVFDAKIENQNLHGHQPADLIIVTAPAFLDAAERLALFHKEQDGMTVNIATTDQIYNEFSSGKQDLIAIRSYLRWLYDKSETAI